MIDPWVEEANYTAQQEIEYERWLVDRPECPFCHEKIGDEEYIDFSEGEMAEGYVWHADCLRYALTYNKLNMTLGERLYEDIHEKWGQ